MAATDASSSKEQLLSLKVMRLSKPSFQLIAPLLCEPNDIAANALLHDPIAFNHPLGLTQILTLPHSFGNIYLGETFSSYISIFNSSGIEVTSVGIKAELQTQTKRVTLLDINPQQITRFSPNESKDFVVSHDVIEEGIHILVCSANYVRPDTERKYFRKFFKFTVENPLAIQCKTHHYPNDLIVAEVSLRNHTKIPLFLDKISLIPETIFIEKELPIKTADSTKGVGSHISDQIFVKPGNVRQFLFALEPIDVCIDDTMVLRKNWQKTRINKTQNANGEETEQLGRMSIKWRSGTGAHGTFTTSPIEMTVPRLPDIKLTLHDIPENLFLEIPFNLRGEIRNCSDKTVEPRIYALSDHMKGISVVGTSGKYLGVLEPGDVTSIPLSFIALEPGLHKINGLRITDSKTNINYDYDNLCDLFIHEKASVAPTVHDPVYIELDFANL